MNKTVKASIFANDVIFAHEKTKQNNNNNNKKKTGILQEAVWTKQQKNKKSYYFYKKGNKVSFPYLREKFVF